MSAGLYYSDGETARLELSMLLFDCHHGVVRKDGTVISRDRKTDASRNSALSRSLNFKYFGLK